MGAIVSSQKKFLQRHNKSPKKGQIKQKKRSRYLANEKQEHSETQEQVLEAATTTTATSNASATQGSKRNDKRRRNSNHGHNSLRRSKHDDKQLEQLPQLVSTISILPRSAWANNFRFRVDEFQCCIDDKETALVEKSSVLKYKTPHFRASARVEVPPVSEGKQLVVGWIQVVRSMTFVNLYGDLGITSWEFPEMATGKQRMISDSDGHRYPWYGARKEVASVRGPKTSPTIVSVSMNDNFSPQVTWHIPAPNPKKASRDPRLTRVYRQQAFTTCLAIMEVSDSGDRDDCYSSNAALGERLLDAGVARLTSTSQVSTPGTFSTTRFTNNNNNIPQATTIFTTRENGAVTSFRAFTTSAQTTTTTTTTTTATPRLQPQQQHHINSVKKNGQQQQQQQQHHLNFKHIVACSSQSDQLKKSQPSLLQSQTSLHQQRKQLKGVCSSEPKLFSRCEQDTSCSNNCINYSTTTTTNQKQRRLHIFNKQPFNRTNDALTPIKRQQQQFSQPQQLQQRHRQDLLENLKTKPVTSSTTKTFTSHSDNWVNSSSSQTSSSSSSSTSSSSPPLQTPSSSSPLQASSLSSPSQMMILKAVDWCMEIEIAVDPSQPIGNRARLINRASSRFSKPEPIEDDERLNHIIDSSALFPPNANRSQVLVWRPFQEVTSQNGEVTCHATPPLSPVASPSLSTPSSSLSSSMTVLAVSSVVPTPSHYLHCNHHHNSSGPDKPTLFSMAQNSLSSPQPLSSSSSSSSSTLVQSISSFSLKPSSSSSSSYSSPLSSSTSTSLPLSPPSSSSSSSLPPSSSSSSLSLTFPPTIVVKPNHTTVDMTQYFQLTTHLRESLFESVVV